MQPKLITTPANRLPGEDTETFQKRIAGDLMQRIKWAKETLGPKPRNSPNALSASELDELSQAIFDPDRMGE